MDPVRLQKGKLISTIDGVVETWDWIINKIKGIKQGKGITVTHTDDGVKIESDPPEIYAGTGIVVTKDDTGGYEISTADDGDDDEDIPELPVLDLSEIGSVTIEGTDETTEKGNVVRFDHNNDSNLTFSVSKDSNGKLIVSVGVYYV